MIDPLGERCKGLESRFDPILPKSGYIIARLDGRAFHTWARGLEKPFDNGLIELMRFTASKLVEETHALLAYIQSDEITLVYRNGKQDSQAFFGGRVNKLNSVLASMATGFFNSKRDELVPQKAGRLAFFDCRVFHAETAVYDLYDVILWRWKDATKNAISSIAQSVFSHKQLQGVSTTERVEMLKNVGVELSDFHLYQLHGVFVQRITETRKLTQDELKDLPEKHAARKNPELLVSRSRIEDFTPNKLDYFWFIEKFGIESKP